MVPVLNAKMQENIEGVEAIILSEINVKEIEYLNEDSDVLTKQIKPNFKTLGPKFGKDMKLITAKIASFTSDDIKQIEKEGEYQINEGITINISDVEITSADIPNCIVANNDGVTIALDINISDKLKEEGLAREFVNRIQNLRKDKGFDVVDTINIEVEKNQAITNAVNNNLDYICGETLAVALTFTEDSSFERESIDLIDNITAKVKIIKIRNNG